MFKKNIQKDFSKIKNKKHIDIFQLQIYNSQKIYLLIKSSNKINFLKLKFQ